MKKFIILAGRRSGVTLLVSSLDSHPKVQCLKEVFSTKPRFRYFQVDKPHSPFFEFRAASVKRQIDYIFRRKQLINEYLTELYTPMDNLQALGIRVAYIQVRKYPAILDWVMENDVAVVHLVRQNSLKVIVSDFTARKRGVHHSTSDVKPVTIHMSPFKLKRYLIVLTKQIETYRTLFKDESYLEVSYEAFVANREAESRRILDFLDVDEFVPLTTDLKKLNPDSLADVIENYEEVAQAFKGTAFEKYLVM